MNKILTFVMAGGKGERLFPLTRERTKPAVPFGGIYRIIDFTLSNCINSGLRKICVLTQYKSSSLNHHLIMGWNVLNSELGEFIDAVPAQQRISDSWYTGTADSIYQNLYLVNEEGPDYVLILAGDHIYKMNYARMVDAHRKSRADLTVAVVETARQNLQRLGIIEVDRRMRVKIFSRQALIEELEEDAGASQSKHDFGRDIIPQMVRKSKKVFAYNFKDSDTNKPRYWRDVGNIDAYYEANMDLVHVTPEFNLYSKSWPIRTYEGQFPPAKTLWSGEEDKGRIGQALSSLISNGCIISGGLVQNSILSPCVRINSFSEVHDSIIMEGADIGRHAKVRRAIIDKDVKISQGAEVGYNPEEDKKKFTVSGSGIVVVPKGSVV
jgi:glucose-1-phosphate adenylyltransferase